MPERVKSGGSENISGWGLLKKLTEHLFKIYDFFVVLFLSPIVISSNKTPKSLLGDRNNAPSRTTPTILLLY